ncbi:hypothetical protein Pint_35945 [Pistacia integerrima]|uniref:Uncharacterized protein n=1 Tax=Pistacia integerrima TaxID=434235 RepID=A0ACC0Y2R6_9ROSI|nr:hypothetical protein Pint_35945 [Pistacia integerrima]
MVDTDKIIVLSSVWYIFNLHDVLHLFFAGHLVAPLIAHVFCNFMGLPMMVARRRGLVTVAFIAGIVAFVWLLFPITKPDLYNYRTENCKCWNGYCSWN